MKRVYIQRESYQPMMEHCLAAWQGFKWLGYEVTFFTADETPYHARCHTGPVVGSTAAVSDFLRAVGLPVPAPLNIPAALQPFAGREHREMSYAEFLEDTQLPVFVKPADHVKLFAGGVLTQQSTKRWALDMCKPDDRLLVCAEVEFASEYRVFVGPKGIEGMKHYMGDPFQVPYRYEIEHMIEAFKPFAPIAYSLDVGTTGISEPETLVVECNDFWALGTYAFDPVRYAELTALRWHQMITNS
jgi:hypothetical protein